MQYSPSRARYKIYVIDEVHMLTKEAFNALLKTLEEPPPHVKFLFATTEVEKMPITILSRCQRFDLGGISLPQITGRLKQIVEQEGMKADDEALELIARRANGSMRDAQSVLDQLLAFGGERLTADQVHNLLGTAGDEHIFALAEAALSGDPRRALEQLEEAVARGFQLAELTDQLIAFWRDSDARELHRRRGARPERARAASGSADTTGEAVRPRHHPRRAGDSVHGACPTAEHDAWPNADRDGPGAARSAERPRLDGPGGAMGGTAANGGRRRDHSGPSDSTPNR